MVREGVLAQAVKNRRCQCAPKGEGTAQTAQSARWLGIGEVSGIRCRGSWIQMW